MFLEADISELSGDTDEARAIYSELDSFRRSLYLLPAKNLEISMRRVQYEVRQSQFADAMEILSGLVFKSNLKIASKVYVLNELLALMRRVVKINPQKATKEDSVKLLEAAIKELPFSRLVYNLYCDYLVDNISYTETVRKIVKAFEGALPRAKKVSEHEFNMTLHMYQSTVRSVCRNINLIFKIEKK